MDRPTYEKLERIVDNHLEKLRGEQERFRELMEGREPDDGPVDWQHEEAVANRLHNLYMGAEHIFKRIAKSIDGELPTGEQWHKDLLTQMSSPHEDRPPVIDDELRTKLLGFLQFRHFYREGYLVDIEWDEMTGLIDDFEDVLREVVDAVEQFMERSEP